MSTVRQYELVYITPPDTTEEALAELHTQIATVVDRFGGNIEKTENWGRRKLAYEISRHREGVYVLEVINGPAAMTAELDRRLRVFDIVIRHMIVRVDEDLAVAERARVAAQGRRWRSAACGAGCRPSRPRPSAIGALEEDDDVDGRWIMGFAREATDERL